MIVLASDHGGYELKEMVKEYLMLIEYNYTDVGCNSAEESCDYPDYVHMACNKINEGDFGIFICGSGNGVNMSANAHNHIISALCWKPEIARLARLHNNANVMCLAGRFMKVGESLNCVEEFLNTQFEGGRHQNRVDKIKNKTFVKKDRNKNNEFSQL